MQDSPNNTMKITHIHEEGAMIINNGSCISYRIYNDYSGRMVNDKEIKKMLRRDRRWKAV